MPSDDAITFLCGGPSPDVADLYESQLEGEYGDLATQRMNILYIVIHAKRQSYARN
jgi:hypothetical protein